jgi:simple sugar transport system ATP-binding protein
LALGREAPWVRRAHLNWGEAQAHTAELISRFEIVAAGPKAPAASLSGGNQQKLVVARELSRKPAVLVAENPTRGLDVGSAAAIHAHIDAAAKAGAAVLFHSNDLDEVLQLAHRIIVVSRGVLMEAPLTATRAEIGNMMLREQLV